MVTFCSRYGSGADNIPAGWIREHEPASTHGPAAPRPLSNWGQEIRPGRPRSPTATGWSISTWALAGRWISWTTIHSAPSWQHRHRYVLLLPHTYLHVMPVIKRLLCVVLWCFCFVSKVILFPLISMNVLWIRNCLWCSICAGQMLPVNSPDGSTFRCERIVFQWIGYGIVELCGFTLRIDARSSRAKPCGISLCSNCHVWS